MKYDFPLSVLNDVVRAIESHIQTLDRTYYTIGAITGDHVLKTMGDVGKEQQKMRDARDKIQKVWFDIHFQRRANEKRRKLKKP